MIGIGERAKREAELCLESLRRSNPGLRSELIDQRMDGMSDMQVSRWAKVNLDSLSPFYQTLYLDADTRPQADLSAGFEILDNGWDLVISPSENQNQDCLWHVGQDERQQTFKELGRRPLQLQAGVFFFRKSEAVRSLFAQWWLEWECYRNQDQAALLRALLRQPVKLWLLGKPWNGGAVVQHLYGRCREESC